MMSILHRIFVSKHKRKKIFTKRKTVYKKFLGLKTLTQVLHTKLSRPYGVRVVKKLPKKRVAVLATTIKPRTQIRFSVLKLLPVHLRRKEIILAHKDIAKFASIKTDTPAQKAPEKKFQAFLPQVVWNKMTAEEKRAHINKRKTLASSRRIKLLQSKYAFSNKRERPVLNKMSFKYRKHYLKNLIKFTNITLSATAPTPFCQHKINEISVNRVKSAISVGKNARAKLNILKYLTCVSIVHPQALALNLNAKVY